MLDTSICKTGATLAPDLALLVSHGKAPLGSPVGWIRVGSGRETHAEEGAASPRPHAGALSQLLPPVLFSWCRPETHPKESGSGLPRAGQAWDGAGWYVGCCWLDSIQAGRPMPACSVALHPQPSSSSPSSQKSLDLTAVLRGTKTFRELV